MLSYLIVATFLPAVIFGHHHIIACPGGLPTPSEIRIGGCDHSPCQFSQGDSITYEIDFLATHTTGSLTLAINATVLGQARTVPLPPGAEDACNSLVVGSCPVTEGETLTQGTTLSVLTEYHGGIPAQLRFQISDIMEHHEHICVCTIVNVIIN